MKNNKNASYKSNLFCERAMRAMLATVAIAFATMTASAGPSNFSYEGRLYDTQGNPSKASIRLILKITDPSGACVLRQEETSTIDLSQSDGYFSVSVGQNSALSGDPSLPFSTLFSNSATLSGVSGCSYTPSPNDGRALSVSIDDGTSITPMNQSVAIGTTPYAVIAENASTLRGYSPTDFLRLTTSSPVVFNSSATTELQNLVSGTSTQYLKSSSSTGAAVPSVAGAPSGTLTAGSMWFNTSTSKLEYYDGSVTQQITVGGGSSGVATVSGAAPITVTSGSNPIVTLAQANSSTNGYLSSSDWNTFNGKLGQTLASGNLYVGNNVGIASAVTPSGDVAVSPTGVFTVNKLQNSSVAITSPTTGQTLRYNGSSWVNAAPASADIVAALGYTPINPTQMPASCSPSQTLTFSSPTGAWTCTAIAVSGSSFGPQSPGAFFAGPASGGSTAPTFRAIASTDLPASGVTAGTYTKVTVYGNGLVTSGANLSSSDIIGALGYTPLGGSTNGAIALSGGSAATGNGADFTIQAQSVTGTGNSPYGGNVVIKPGVGSTYGGNVLIGTGTAATGSLFSFSLGNQTTIGSSCLGCVVAGEASSAAANGAAAFGTQASANGNYSVAIGYNSTTSGSNAVAIGGGSATGQSAMAFGLGTSAPSFNATSLGSYNIGLGTNPTSWSNSDPILEIGNGASSGARSNAMTILKNGNVGIGTTTPNAALDIKGNGGLRLEASSNGYVGFQAPSSVAANVTWTLPSADGTSGQVLSTNGSGMLSWVSGSSGSVNSVSPGTGPIVIGGTSAAPTVGITQATTSTDGYLATVDWNTFNSKLGPTTSFTGDVSGTYSATVVSKLQGAVLNIISPSNGQILRYSGSSWVNGSLASSDVITALGYTPINAGQMPGNCGASQTLTFSSPTGSWFCSTIVVNGSAFATQAQATFLAGPTSGSGTPSFRTIASTDLPASALSQWTTSGSNIYYATSGGNVGLNVSSPTAALHLRAGTSAVGGAPLKFSTGSLLTTPEAGAIEFDGANLYYTNSSSARMVVATAGGTITASAGTATAPSFAFSSDAMSGMFSPGSQTLGITTGGVERIHIDSSGNIAFGAGFTSPQSPFDFVDTVTIRGGGHLGINTSSPSYDLDYQGSGATTYLPSGTGATVPALFTAINNANTQAGDGHGAFYYMAPTNTASVSQTAYIGAISNGGGSYSPTMVFGRATGTSSWAETMRIDGNTGAVGIGTTSPSANLHVRSTSGSAPTFMVQNGSTGGAIVIASGGSAAAPVYQISKISISTSCSPSSLNVGQSVICTASTTASTLNLPSNASSHFLNCYQNGGSNQIVGSGVLNGTALSIAGVAGASGSVSTVVFTCMVTSM